MRKVDWVSVIIYLIFAWLIISFFDVVFHNGVQNPQYAFWNIWAILFHH